MRSFTCFLLPILFFLFHSTRSQRIRAVQAPSARNQLLSKLLKGYDKEKSSTVPVLVYTSMIIEHLREFNEYDMTLHMQSVFIMNWRDERLVWEPKDYGNLTKIPIDDYKVQRFWLPKVTARAIMPLQRPIIQPLNTELLILSDGFVYSISQISTPTTCQNSLALYPYDTPHCSLYIVNRNRDDKLVFGNRQMFNLRNAFVIGNNVTLNPGYEIFNFTLQRYYLTSDGFQVQNTEEPNYVDWKKKDRTIEGQSVVTLGSLIEYQFFFRRNTSTYLSSVLLPLYLCTLVLLLGACIEDLRRSLIVLVFGCFLLFTTVFRISLGLPPNYLDTPFCMKYGIAISIEAFVLLFYKVAFGYVLQNVEEEKEVSGSLITANRYFSYFLVLQALFCTWLLFF